MSGNVFPQHVFPLDRNWFSSPDIICALWLVAIFSSRDYSSVFAVGTWVWPPECALSPEVPSSCEDKQYISHYCMVPCSMGQSVPNPRWLQTPLFHFLECWRSELDKACVNVFVFCSPLVLFSISWDPIPDQINSGEEGLLSAHSLEKSIMVRKA